MKTFRIMLVKELKSMLRDPKIIIAMLLVPLVLTAIMYGAMIGLMGQVAEEARRKGGTLVLVDEDHGNWTAYIVKTLRGHGYRIINASSTGNARRIIQSENALGGIVIPRGFSEDLTMLRPARITVLAAVKSISIISFTRTGKVMGIVEELSSEITRRITASRGIPENFTSKPIESSILVIFKNKVVTTSDIGALIGGLVLLVILVPILVMILSGFIAQLSATSIAVEKEEKMLETLLSLPLSRTQLIAAKVVASAIVGFLGVIIYGGLYVWFYSSMAGLGSGAGASSTFSGLFSIAGEVIGPYTLTALFIGLVGLVLLILGLAILLSLFVEDVRSAQIVSGYIIAPLTILILVSMFIDPAAMTPSTRLAVALIPMINIGMIIPYGFIGDTLSITTAVASTLVYASIVIWYTARVVSTEKIFTMRLFKRRRRGGRGRSLFKR